MNQKILVLEDERSLRVILSDNLKFDGFKVIAASTGKDALELASKERPDLAIIDVGLPDIDGWQVYRRLQQKPETQDIQIVMLSGNFGDEVNDLPPKLDRRRLLSKPYEYSDLLKLVRDILDA